MIFFNEFIKEFRQVIFVKVRKAYSIENLYEKVKDYDLVLTVDAPLAEALNNRLEHSRLGNFAITPRGFAQNKHQNENLADQRELFIRAIQDTDLTWKQAFYLIENILNCWQETGELRAILKYNQFNNEETRKAIRVIEKTKNIHSAMEKHKVDEEGSIAVIGLYQFNELDKKVLPKNYDVINAFQEDKRKLPSFHIFGTITGIIQAIQGNITKTNADDIALVTPTDSEYQPILKSVFQSKNIPFMSKTDFSEKEDLRTFLLFLRSALSSERLRLRDVQAILRRMGIEVSIRHNNKFLKNLEIDEISNFRKALERIKGLTFKEAIKEFEKWGKELEKIQEELSEINLLEKKVNQETVNQLEYYLDSFQIQVGSTKRGVLFASPKTTSYIDRPIIFYIGMDFSWTHPRPDKPWIDEENYEDRNLNNFELLLQNGEQQYFLVRDNSMGGDITPCLYFDEILEEDFDTFDDFPHKKYWGLEQERGERFEKEDIKVNVEDQRTISQSSLNKLVKCPRDYFFSRIIDEEGKHYFKTGNLFHDFAEFYVNYPDIVEREGIDKFVEIMSSEIQPYIADFGLDQIRTKFKLGIKNIVKYLDSEEIEIIELEGYEKKYSYNIFADKYEKNIDSPITEVWFENSDIGGKGKIDLIKTKNHLVDYKSGKIKSARRIVQNSNVDLFEDEPNFQALLYLAHHRQVNPNTRLKFTFFHLLENIEDEISGEADLRDNIVTITYYPKTFSEKLIEEETFDFIRKGVSERNYRRKTLEKMGFEKYHQFFEDHDLPYEYDQDKLLASDLLDDFIAFAKSIIGDYKYVTKGCKKILKKIVDYRTQNYFKEDLDAFEEFLQDQLEKINEYKQTRFPVGDINLDKIGNRDLIIGGEFGS